MQNMTTDGILDLWSLIEIFQTNHTILMIWFPDGSDENLMRDGREDIVIAHNNISNKIFLFILGAIHPIESTYSNNDQGEESTQRK